MFENRLARKNEDSVVDVFLISYYLFLYTNAFDIKYSLSYMLIHLKSEFFFFKGGFRENISHPIRFIYLHKKFTFQITVISDEGTIQ